MVMNQNMIESKFDAKIWRKITGTITGQTCQKCYRHNSHFLTCY